MIHTNLIDYLYLFTTGFIGGLVIDRLLAKHMEHDNDEQNHDDKENIENE